TLVTILVGLTLVILADAMRRMIRDRRSQFKLKGLSKNAPDFGNEDEFDNPELPSGGARVVARRFSHESPEEAPAVAAAVAEPSAEASTQTEPTVATESAPKEAVLAPTPETLATPAPRPVVEEPPIPAEPEQV